MKHTLFNRRNLILTATLALLAVTGARASATKYEVIERQVNERRERTKGWDWVEVELPGLLDERFAETRDFKIVDQKKNDPLEWEKLPLLEKRRAANLIHHLTKAKQYFLKRYQSEEVARLEQITIRTNFANKFSKYSLYMSELGDNGQVDEKRQIFNNANSIPASVPADLEDTDYTPWQRQIWFRPAKEIPMKQLLAGLNEDPMTPTIRSVRKVLYPMQLDQTISNTIFTLFTPHSTADMYVKDLTRQAGTILMVEGAFQLMKIVNRLLLPDHYSLDTSMVPEIIYHEFAHIALSDSLTPTHSTPVVEGMADYFAAAILGSPELAVKIKKFSTGTGKNGRKAKEFKAEYEMNSKATGDFVLSMLWGLRDREVLGEEVADDVIWESRKHLSTFDSDITHGLVSALKKACERNSACDRHRLLNYLSAEIKI